MRGAVFLMDEDLAAALETALRATDGCFREHFADERPTWRAALDALERGDPVTVALGDTNRGQVPPPMTLGSLVEDCYQCPRPGCGQRGGLVAMGAPPGVGFGWHTPPLSHRHDAATLFWGDIECLACGHVAEEAEFIEAATLPAGEPPSPALARRGSLYPRHRFGDDVPRVVRVLKPVVAIPAGDVRGVKTEESGTVLVYVKGCWNRLRDEEYEVLCWHLSGRDGPCLKHRPVFRPGSTAGGVVQEPVRFCGECGKELTEEDITEGGPREAGAAGG